MASFKKTQCLISYTNTIFIKQSLGKISSRKCKIHRQIIVQNVTPLVLDVEEEDEDEGLVHRNDGDDHQHAAVKGGHHPAMKGNAEKNLLINP